MQPTRGAPAGATATGSARRPGHAVVDHGDALRRARSGATARRRIRIARPRRASMRRSAMPARVAPRPDRGSCASETAPAPEAGHRRGGQQARTVQVYQIGVACALPVRRICRASRGVPARKRAIVRQPISCPTCKGRNRCAPPRSRARARCSKSSPSPGSPTSALPARVADRRQQFQQILLRAAEIAELVQQQQLHSAHGQRQHPEIDRQHAPVGQQVAGRHLHHLAGPEAQHPHAEEGALRARARGGGAQDRDVEPHQRGQSRDTGLHQQAEVHVVGHHRRAQVVGVGQGLVADAEQRLPGMRGDPGGQGLPARHAAGEHAFGGVKRYSADDGEPQPVHLREGRKDPPGEQRAAATASTATRASAHAAAVAARPARRAPRRR